eukprot:90746_1
MQCCKCLFLDWFYRVFVSLNWLNMIDIVTHDGHIHFDWTKSRLHEMYETKADDAMSDDDDQKREELRTGKPFSAIDEHDDEEENTVFGAFDIPNRSNLSYSTDKLIPCEWMIMI